MNIFLVVMLLVGVYLLGSQVVWLWLNRVDGNLKPLVAIGIGLLGLYPIGLFQVAVIEGQENIYQTHIFWELAWLYGLILGFYVYRRWRSVKYQKLWVPLELTKKQIVAGLVVTVVLGWGLGWADVNGDERDLGVRAYDLMDGIRIGRKSYVLSFHNHSPLGFYVQHFVMNAAHPYGMETVSKFSLRLTGLLMAVLTFWLSMVWVWRLTKNTRVVWLAGLVLVGNTAFLFSGRLAIYQDLAMWNFYFLLSLLMLSVWIKSRDREYLWLMGIFLGALGLTKMTALAVLPVFVIWVVWRNKSVVEAVKLVLVVGLMMTPVMVFNVMAYIFAGYVDVPTAMVLRKLGVEVNSLMPSTGIYSGGGGGVGTNFVGLVQTIADMIQPMVLLGLVGGVLVGLYKNSRQESFVLVSAWLVLFGFYVVVGFRTYYLTSLVVVLVILFAIGLAKLKSRGQLAATMILCMFSGWYSFNSLYRFSGNQYLEAEYGRSDDTTALVSITRDHSYSIRSWLANTDLELVVDYVDKNWQEKTLVLDESTYTHTVLWHLKFDAIRSALDEEYDFAKQLARWPGFGCDEEFLLLTRKQGVQEICGQQLELKREFRSDKGEGWYFVWSQR